MNSPTDEQLDELWDEIGGYYNLYPEVRNTIREALNRWGNPEQKENSNDLIFYNNGEENFRIPFSNIGRGNVCPETKLEINKNDRSN